MLHLRLCITLFFSYDISKASGIGTSWSDEQMLSLAPKKSEYWMINWDNKKKGYVFDDEKWARIFLLNTVKKDL